MNDAARRGRQGVGHVSHVVCIHRRAGTTVGHRVGSRVRCMSAPHTNSDPAIDASLRVRWPHATTEGEPEEAAVENEKSAKSVGERGASS